MSRTREMALSLRADLRTASTFRRAPRPAAPAHRRRFGWLAVAVAVLAAGVFAAVTAGPSAASVPSVCSGQPVAAGYVVTAVTPDPSCGTNANRWSLTAAPVPARGTVIACNVGSVALPAGWVVTYLANSTTCNPALNDPRVVYVGADTLTLSPLVTGVLACPVRIGQPPAGYYVSQNTLTVPCGPRQSNQTPATTGPTWTLRPLPTPPSGSVSVCRTNPYQIPAGWTVASSSQTATCDPRIAAGTTVVGNNTDLLVPA